MGLREEYRERNYRRSLAPVGMVTFEVAVKETDLFIAATEERTERAHRAVLRCRQQIESYIHLYPSFLSSLVPLHYDTLAPIIVREMMQAALAASVGPMAAVAGAIAEYVGRDLRSEVDEVIVENGGDIFLDCQREVRVGIFAGRSPLSNKLTVAIKPENMPLGVCTSSATVGPSLSFGKADAVCIIARSAALADAAASAVGNVVKSEKAIKDGLHLAEQISGVSGALIVIGDKLGLWGDITLV